MEVYVIELVEELVRTSKIVDVDPDEALEWLVEQRYAGLVESWEGYRHVPQRSSSGSIAPCSTNSASNETSGQSTDSADVRISVSIGYNSASDCN